MTITANSFVKLKVKGEDKATADIKEFAGNWVYVVENVTYGSLGHIETTITRIRDGKTLLHFSGNVGSFWGGSYMRPKWGIYRSLTDKQQLRNEKVLFTDICVA